jgi:hypothetical protein
MRRYLALAGLVSIVLNVNSADASAVLKKPILVKQEGALFHLIASKKKVPSSKIDPEANRACLDSDASTESRIAGCTKVLSGEGRDTDYRYVILYIRGSIYLEAHQWAEAEADFGSMIEMRPSEGDNYHTRAYLRGMLSNNEGRLADLKTFVRLSSGWLSTDAKTTLENQIASIGLVVAIEKKYGDFVTKDLCARLKEENWNEGADPYVILKERLVSIADCKAMLAELQLQ